MRKWISTAIILACAAGVLAEDVVLSDKRVFVGATIFPIDKDGFVVISGKDERGIDYVARVQPGLLPGYIRKRMGLETDRAETAEPKVEIARDPIEISNFTLIALDPTGDPVSYSWKVSVTNNTSRRIALRSRVVLLNKESFELAEAIGGSDVIGPHSTEVLTGSSSVKAVLWRQKHSATVNTLQ